MRRNRFVEPTGQPVATLEIDFHKVKVYLDEGGRFYAKGPHDERLQGKSLDQLRASLRKVIKETTPIAVQATLLEHVPEFDFSGYWSSEDDDSDAEQLKRACGAEPEPANIFDIEITGRQRSRDISYSYQTPDGETETATIYAHSNQIVRRLTQEERVNLELLARRRFLAERDYQVFIESVGIDDIDDRLRQAVAAAILQKGGGE